MNGRHIAAAWFTFAWLIFTGTIFSFLSMGDCIEGDICEPLPLFAPTVFAIAGLGWLLGVTRILRHRKKP
jgi:hypothetical protein